MIWLVVLFVVPFYAMLAIGEGKLDRQTESPVAVYQPVALELGEPVERLARPRSGRRASSAPSPGGPIWYVAVASLLSLVIAYPAAYFVARFAGRRKGCSWCCWSRRSGSAT